MLFLTNDKLISLFKSNPSNSQYKVKIGSRLVPLSEYVKTKDKLTGYDIQQLMENIRDRDEYLSRFYEVSLKVPESLNIKDPPMKNGQMNNNALVKYKNIIRNMFYKEILKDTKSGIENNPTFFDVLEDLYVNKIIDYKILTPSSLYEEWAFRKCLLFVLFSRIHHEPIFSIFIESVCSPRNTNLHSDSRMVFILLWVP